jgi:hypothetical protein
LEPSIFTIQWFVCLFSNSLHVDIVKLVWDYLFIKGSTILFKVGLVVLDYCCKDLVKATDFSDAILIIEETLKGIKDLE